MASAPLRHIETGILNVTMDRMADKIEEEFVNLPHSIRTSLAYIEQHGADGALARIARDEARHARTWHRALKLLRELQNEKKPNEPEPRLTPVVPIRKTGESVAPHGGTTGSAPVSEPSHADAIVNTDPRDDQRDGSANPERKL